MSSADNRDANPTCTASSSGTTSCLVNSDHHGCTPTLCKGADGNGDDAGLPSTQRQQPPDCVCFPSSPAPLPEDAPEASLTDRLRAYGAEFVGTALLLIVVVGSGITAERLSDDVGVQLLINSFATGLGLFGLITVLGPVSGAHLNPIVSMVDALYGDMKVTPQCAAYVTAQISGAVVGTVLANAQFEESVVAVSHTERFGYHLWIGEVLATATLIVVIHGCIRTGQKSQVPAVVAAWVAGGYFFTSSSIFANPAVTVGRVFTDTFTGIEPASMALYVVFQIVGGVVGYGVSRVLFPTHLQPASTDDNLYRRACVLDLKDFVDKASY